MAARRRPPDLARRTEVAQSRAEDSSIGASVEGERNQSSSAIRRWLNDLGLGQYGDAFEQNDLDIDVLRDLSELDLEKIGVSLGHRKKLIRAIAALGPPSKLRPAHDRRQMDDTASPTGERRQATVLFSDLSGYTAMNEALDPEDVERVMSRIKSDAVVIVERHGGLVNQFIGDEVVALFGIASAHEDDPVRAVRTALELHEMVRTITPEIEQRLGQRIRLHTGINTGLGIAGDISNESGVAALAEQIARQFPRLSILVNNAGKTWGAPLETFPHAAWENVFSVNVAGLFTLTQRLMPQLTAAATTDDPARIINLGSVMGSQPMGDGAYSYAASKAAVHHLTRILAKELAARRITVNALAPGVFDSRMTAFATRDAAQRTRVEQRVPLGRLGRPEDIAGAVLFLCGRGGAYVTGAILPIDGGVGVDSGADLWGTVGS
jgi:NAD(P)-dependent dehydrogenase (short-subunit alcohol dehydrogenase family)